VRAYAALAVERRGSSSRCTTVRSSPPLSIRPTPGIDSGGGSGVSVHLVGSAAGPVGGDRLDLAVLAGERSSLTVRSVAATLVLPGPSPGPAAHLDVRADVRAGARLLWLPEPTILVRGSDLRSTTTLRVASGATVVWSEVVVLGRAGEPSGSVLQRLRVDVADRPLLRADLAVGPRWPASQGPAVVGGARAIGTAVVVGTDVSRLEPVATPCVQVGRADLDGDAAVITALGADPGAVVAAIAAHLAPVADA
jgi:urease accessory protein